MTPCTMDEVDRRARILDAVKGVQRGPRTTDAIVREVGYNREYVVAVLAELAAPMAGERRTHQRGIIVFERGEWRLSEGGWGKYKRQGG